jgi:hypothetical protein
MNRFILILIGLVLTTTSCKTYYMTPDSFKDQLQNIDPNKITDAYDFRLGLVGVALKGGKNFYNGITSIKVTDKHGNAIVHPVNTNTQVRLTNNDGRRIILYFDSVFLRDSLVYGSKSHFITLHVTPMNINTLTKIEFQQ